MESILENSIWDGIDKLLLMLDNNQLYLQLLLNKIY